ncbi:radical SAM domain protein [gut metagenome]|uniref:Radical SAM domain protein n=1 Tax=gut metagenome TaxID=749906 RepID=J9GH44_9ZZZZ
MAPEHTSDRVLYLMRKPSFQLFHKFKRVFDRINREAGLKQQLIPYFISSHPGCEEMDMAELAAETKELNFQLEQVQDFTPTPMTVATETWYSGYHPYTLEEVFSAKTPEDKRKQNMFFFWYKAEERNNILNELRRMGRDDLIAKIYGNNARTFTNNAGRNRNFTANDSPTTRRNGRNHPSNDRAPEKQRTRNAHYDKPSTPYHKNKGRRSK